MSEKVKYKTKQRQRLQEFLEASAGSHFTAADVCAYFRERECPIGMTTVYRRLEELVGNGQVKKYIIDENSSACFEYVGNECGHPFCYHLKCEQCGKLIHLDCREIRELEEHIAKNHKFLVNPMRTVFYGICEQCKKA